jgi:hypothetical protein
MAEAGTTGWGPAVPAARVEVTETKMIVTLALVLVACAAATPSA